MPLPASDRAPGSVWTVGPIHPRFKHEVGRRLATALLKNVSGPTIAGCAVTQGTSIEITLDAARMGGEDVAVQPFDTNVSACEHPPQLLQTSTSKQASRRLPVGWVVHAFMTCKPPQDRDESSHPKLGISRLGCACALAGAGTDSSSLMICTGALGPAVANETSCACSGWAYVRAPCTRQGCNSSNHGDDQARQHRSVLD